jgi:hypothetical protein
MQIKSAVLNQERLHSCCPGVDLSRVKGSRRPAVCTSPSYLQHQAILRIRLSNGKCDHKATPIRDQNFTENIQGGTNPRWISGACVYWGLSQYTC